MDTLLADDATEGTSIAVRSWRTGTSWFVGLVGAAIVLVATRREPNLSADSLTYLSAAEHLQRLDGYADFTGEPLAHFPPVFPMLLAMGGRSLGWASVVGAAAASAVGASFAWLLSGRVRAAVAAVAGISLVLASSYVRIASTVWSETPFLALALGTMALLGTGRVDSRRAALAGAVTGAAFLTRYAGAGLMLAGLVMVVASTRGCGRGTLLRRAVAYAIVPSSLALAWVIRNVMATGEPLGPHFEGGSGDRPAELVERTAEALGRLLVDSDLSGREPEAFGYVVLVFVVGCSFVVLTRWRSARVCDLGMAAFALSSIVVPIASRAVAGTHIEFRIISPVLVPTVYFTAVLVDRWWSRRVVVVVAVVLAAAGVAGGLREAARFPERIDRSAGNPNQFSAELYAVLASLPREASIVTNNPQRVWWNTGRVPTSFGFTEPEPGNSHFPLGRSELLATSCEVTTYLAWFPGLGNAGGRSPEDVRPDLASVVRLVEVRSVRGGTLYALEPVAFCQSPDH